MFCSKCSNKMIVKTHFRCLASICNMQTEAYRDFLHINGKTNPHKQNIQPLMIEIYKCLNQLSPSFIILCN